MATSSSSATQPDVPSPAAGPQQGVERSQPPGSASESEPGSSSTRSANPAPTPRNRFYVKLKDGIINVVSWKRLMKAKQSSHPMDSRLPREHDRESVSVINQNPIDATHQEERLGVSTRSISVMGKMKALYKGGEAECKYERANSAAGEDIARVCSSELQEKPRYDTESDYVVYDPALNAYRSCVREVENHPTGFSVDVGRAEIEDRSMRHFKHPSPGTDSKLLHTRLPRMGLRSSSKTTK